jgi:hypothetical protein
LEAEAMTDALLVTLPLRTYSEVNLRQHWARKSARVKLQRGTTRMLFSQHRIPPLPICVALVRISPRALDDDNLRSALKAIRDGIADWLGIDDRDARVRWEYEQRRSARRQHGVEVRVMAMSST